MKRFLLVMIVVLLLSGCEFILAPDVSIALQPGYDIVGQGEEWNDEGCLITIDEETDDMETSMTVDTAVLQTTTILYTYTTNNETYYCRRVVRVIDNVPPVVTLNPGIDTIALGEEHIDAGVEVLDNSSTEVTISTESNLDINQPGQYTITYSVRDEEGNLTIVTRIVTVMTDQ